MRSQGDITRIKKISWQHCYIYKRKILEYRDPFLNVPARHLKTGVEIDANIVLDLLSSTEIGNEIPSIPKSKNQNGLDKIKVNNNTLDVIKEDRQAFGLLVGKV